jgi:hypothetical protein
MHETTRSHKRSDLEWMDLIHECRTSGLGDKEWCKHHQIPISTFYTKITKLRQKACDIPKANQRSIGQSQQVVPLSILDESPIPLSDAILIQTDSPAVIIKMNDYSIAITNHAARDTIFNTLSVLQQLC